MMNFKTSLICNRFVKFKAAVPNPFGTRDQLHGGQFFHGWGQGGMVQMVMRAMGSDGERWGVADEASLAR